MARTLAQWALDWPYRVKRFQPTDARTGLHSGPVTDDYVTPDTGSHETLRREAFNLADYRVTAVTGGSLWFSPRDIN